MKVLHLTTHLNSGGITNYILGLIEPLKEFGCETCVLSSGGEMAPVLRDRGAQLLELPIRTKNELHPKLYSVLPAVKEFIRTNQIDLLHAHTRITQVLAYWTQKQTRIPIVTTCHGFYKRRLGRRLIPAWGDRAIAISGPVGDHLLRDFKFPEERIRRINNGVNLTEIDSFYPALDPLREKKAFGFGADDLVVGIVARLVSDKGHEYLIRAVNELRIPFPHIKLLIAGDGNYRPALEKLVHQFGLEERVRFSGNLKSRDVLRSLAATDIFALPATWREGFGLSIVEAMACRKPVIVTNIWSLNSLIRDNETGILIEPKQVRPLVDAVTFLIENDAARRQMGERARGTTEQFFSIPRMAKEIYGVYEELVKA